MKRSILIAALLITHGVAYAAASDNCNGNGSCATGSTTNQGGNGYGVGVGIAGASATGGNSNVDVRNTNANVQGQIQGQGQKQSTSNANNSTNSVVVEGDNFEAKRIPVNTAYAPSIAPTANCALSVSGGMSFVGFSGSFGKAYIDENCAALERVRTVSLVLGDKQTAEALMCLDEKYKKARSNSGRACPIEQE